jgi:hypothetical protein
MKLPTIPPTIAAFLVNIFSNNTGAIARVVAGAVVAGVTTALIKMFGYTLTEEENLKVAGYVTAGVTWSIGEVTTYLQNQNVAAMQTVLQTAFPAMGVDSHVGAQTVAAVQKIVDVAAEATASVGAGSANLTGTTRAV